MATALIDVTIDGLTNEQVNKATKEVLELLKTKWPQTEAQLNEDSEYDDEDESPD